MMAGHSAAALSAFEDYVHERPNGPAISQVKRYIAVLKRRINAQQP